MSEQINKQETPQHSAEQYLMAAFSRADWIAPEYKRLSATCKDNPIAFRELYLCACDKVPIDVVQIALSNEPVVENLINIRNKHFEKRYTDMQSFFMNELTETVQNLRKEVDSVSDAAKYFADTIPGIEELFSNKPDGSSHGKTLTDITKEAEMEEKVKGVPKFGTSIASNEKSAPSKTPKRKWSITDVLVKKDKPADFLNELYQKGYKDEAISYIISCLENGLSEKEIRTFISPSFDVATMERLRKLYVKE